LPKGTDLSVYSHEQLGGIADLMNGGLRKTLDWYTPHEVYRGWLAKFDDPTEVFFFPCNSVVNFFKCRN
jgi:hypothetical protein